VRRVRATARFERDKREQIVRAALTQAGAQGVSKMTLRGVAAACGVSLGLVQHYFGTKAALVAAVDDYVLARFADILDTRSFSACDRQPDWLAHQFAHLLARRPEVMDYLGRALCDGEAIGAVIFDRLVAVSAAHTPARTEPAAGASGPDPVWEPLHPLILMLGTIMCRGHIERHLHRPLNDPEQLAHWDSAVTSLMRDGYIRREVDSA